MLDTNIVSHIMRRTPQVLAQLRKTSVGQVHISAITAGELHFGLAKNPGQAREQALQALLDRVQVLPWDDTVARHYGALRAQLMQQGKSLAPLDMQIAAHARAMHCVLVTNDQAFAQVPKLKVLDWVRTGSP